MKKAKFSIFLVPVTILCLLTIMFGLSLPAYAQTVSVHLAMGNPSSANAFVLTNYLLEKPQYVVSYNCSKGIPNWVSWQLNRSWLGNAPRQNSFRPDTTLPANCSRVTASDYTGGGFDRGHLAPSADRDNTIENNSATFLMTNMIPQAPDSNQGIWADLEDYCRDLVEAGKELYIIAGGYGTGGIGSNGFATAIAKGKVVVPARTWKVIVVLDSAGNASSVSDSTRLIAVDIPNMQGIRNDKWKKYRVSVDSIESATGYDLLSNVSPSIQSVIEAKVDNQ
jgi:endonuclease G, mitochondrial